MNRLKRNQLGPWCSFCAAKTTRAVYVQTGWHGYFCCAGHKAEMAKHEQEDDKLTEADHQTWMQV
jgi:hypothetical protein